MAWVIIWEPLDIPELGYRLLRLIRRPFRSRIFSAIEKGDDEAVLRLATKRRLKSASGEWGESPLVACISAERSTLACKLIDLEGHRKKDGALAHAAMRNDILVVKKLLDCGSNPNEPLPSKDFCVGYTPLMWATNRHYFDVMLLLLEAGANIDAISKDRSTAISMTREARDEDLKALDILCRYNPCLTIKDWRGLNILDEARNREKFGGKKEMRLLLQKHFPLLSFDER